MRCEEIENQILELEDNDVASEMTAEINRHLAICPSCRTFAAQLHHLDGALKKSITIPALSPAFDQRLWKQIQSLPQPLSAQQLAERKQQLEKEFEDRLAQIRQRSFAWQKWVMLLRWPALGIWAGLITWQLVSAAPYFHISIPSSVQWLASAIVFLCFGLIGSRDQPWKWLHFRGFRLTSD